MILFSLQPLEFCLCCLSPKLIHEFSSLPRWQPRHRAGWARGTRSFLKQRKYFKRLFFLQLWQIKCIKGNNCCGYQELFIFFASTWLLGGGTLLPAPALGYILLFLEQKVAVIRIGEVVLEETEPSDKFDTVEWLVMKGGIFKSKKNCFNILGLSCQEKMNEKSSYFHSGQTCKPCT